MMQNEQNVLHGALQHATGSDSHGQALIQDPRLGALAPQAMSFWRARKDLSCMVHARHVGLPLLAFARDARSTHNHTATHRKPGQKRQF